MQQTKYEEEGWVQLHNDYNESHDDKDNDEFDTPGLSSEEDDLATILDLPPAKPKRRDIKNDTNEAASTMTKIQMTGDIITHENAITVDEQDLHIGEEEMLTHDTNLHDGKNEIIQGARSDDMHMNEGAEYVTTSNRHDAYETAYKMDDDKAHTETNKMADMHEYEEESLTKNEHPRCGNVMTSQTETVDATKILAYMDVNYNIPSQKGDETENLYNIDEDKPTAALGNLYSIGETNQEEDAANKEHTNGVPNMKEPRGSP